MEINISPISSFEWAECTSLRSWNPAEKLRGEASLPLSSQKNKLGEKSQFINTNQNNRQQLLQLLRERRQLVNSAQLSAMPGWPVNRGHYYFVRTWKMPGPWVLMLVVWWWCNNQLSSQMIIKKEEKLLPNQAWQVEPNAAAAASSLASRLANSSSRHRAKKFEKLIDRFWVS